MAFLTCMLTKFLLFLMIFVCAWILKDGVVLVGEIRSTSRPLTIEATRDAALDNMLTQEKAKAQKRLSDMDKVLEENSHPLPNRETNKSANELCKVKNACAPKFLQLETRVRVAPVYKMLNCIVQKSMSTIVTAVMCYLYDEIEFLKAGRDFEQEWSRFRFCMDKNEYNSVSAAKDKLKIKNDSDWSYTMVTRDPVERFISGFVDRCIRKPLGPRPCNGCGYNMTCFVESEYKRMMTQVKEEKLKRSFEDVHLFPQNWRCELNNEYKKFEFIPYSSGKPDEFIDTFMKVAAKQNVSQTSIDFIKAQIKRTKTVHITTDSPARKYLEERLRNSPYLMEYVVKMFYYDFRLFNYSFPPGF